MPETFDVIDNVDHLASVAAEMEDEPCSWPDDMEVGHWRRGGGMQHY
jgi:hypothetical protein